MMAAWAGLKIGDKRRDRQERYFGGATSTGPRASD